MKKQANAKALLPILVFLALYLGLGIVFEYGMKISMGFYSIPVVVVFLIALLVACLQNKAISFDEKLTIMGQGVGDKNIMTMILIFLAAGVFVGVTGRSSAEAVAYFLLSVTPAWTAVAVLFIASCFSLFFCLYNTTLNRFQIFELQFGINDLFISNRINSTINVHHIIVIKTT